MVPAPALAQLPAGHTRPVRNTKLLFVLVKQELMQPPQPAVTLELVAPQVDGPQPRHPGPRVFQREKTVPGKVQRHQPGNVRERLGVNVDEVWIVIHCQSLQLRQTVQATLVQAPK